METSIEEISDLEDFTAKEFIREQMETSIEEGSKRINSSAAKAFGKERMESNIKENLKVQITKTRNSNGN